MNTANPVPHTVLRDLRFRFRRLGWEREPGRELNLVMERVLVRVREIQVRVPEKELRVRALCFHTHSLRDCIAGPSRK